MAVIFLGVSMMLLSVYVLVNRNGNEPQTGGTKKENLFSMAGPAIEGQNTDMNEGWDALYSGAIKESPEDRNNVTKNVAKAAFYQMKALDQQGKSPFDESNTNTPEVQAAIESSLDGSVDSFFGNLMISDRDIKISANNTRAAKVAYLKSIEGILARHPMSGEYKNIPGGLQGIIEESCGNGDSGINKGIADIYAATEKEFIATRVPSAWVNFHKEVIEHYKKGNMIFMAISDCLNDPLKGIAAAQKISIFGMDGATLQNLLKKMYTEVGL